MDKTLCINTLLAAMVAVTVVSGLNTTETAKILGNRPKIEWKSVNHNEAVILRGEPAGREKSVDNYICRGELDGTYYVGKLRFDRSILCYFAHNGTEHTVSDFQILDRPVGTTSWVPLDNGRLMCNPIFSTIPTGPNKIPPFTFPSHVCRAKVNDVLVPGYMYSMATAHIVECHVPYWGEKIVADIDNIELLVLNMYADQIRAVDMVVFEHSNKIIEERRKALST